MKDGPFCTLVNVAEYAAEHKEKSDVLHYYIGNNLPGLLSIQEMFFVRGES